MFDQSERNTVAAPKSKWWPKVAGVILLVIGVVLLTYAWWGWGKLHNLSEVVIEGDTVAYGLAANAAAMN